MRSLIILCGLALLTHPLLAQSDASERCLRHMDALLDQLTTLEHSASNDAVRAQCIVTKRNKIKGLRELTAAAAARLPKLVADEDVDTLAAEQSAIAIACARVDKLAAEAGLCDDAPANKSKHRRVTSEPVTAPLQNRPSGKRLRDEQDCLRQIKLAGLLLRVMELSPDPKKPPQTVTDQLAQFAIEPLHGWRPDECATLDDFCVAVARALNLKVAIPDDPASYLQALRDEALPVDACLPERIEGLEPPLLLESEARSFFAKGYAVPLPSSRPLE